MTIVSAPALNGTKRVSKLARMASPFAITSSCDEARLGVLTAPSGKVLDTPALLTSTTHGHCFHSDNSTVQRWRQQHPQMAVAVCVPEMCEPCVDVLAFLLNARAPLCFSCLT